MEYTDEDVNNFRFAQELEFVSCLSSPDYLKWLHKEGLFEDPAFIRYLNYLLYWTKIPYSSFIQYPVSLRYLRALQDEKFRNNLKNDKAIELLWRQQNVGWLVTEQTPQDPDDLEREHKQREQEAIKATDDQIEQCKKDKERNDAFLQENVRLIQEEAGDDDNDDDEDDNYGDRSYRGSGSGGKRDRDGKKKGWTVNDAFKKKERTATTNVQNNQNATNKNAGQVFSTAAQQRKRN
eukprot:GDKJ01015737.1.p1 GENE.GDKJ01015737.1~~GDKJ01015737.1.p1  ORF type:complete len:236 (+),score=58.06 GDKJ01015737.1:23-730(+)